jgi:hypothetical protein
VIAFAVILLLNTSPVSWTMGCVQMLEAIAQVEKDEFFNRPENKWAKQRLIRKLRRHGPPDCILVRSVF